MEEKHTPAAAEGVQPEPSTNSPQGTRRPGGRGWVAALGVLLLVVIGGGAVLGYRYWHQMQSNLQLLNQVLAQAQREQAQLQQRIERANELFAAQSERIQGDDQSFQAEREVLEEASSRKLKLQEDAMHQAVAMAQERMGSGSANWMLAEAEYLMRLAQRRLTLDQDVLSAREALAAADERLRDTGDPQWAEVREVLGGEMSALAAVPVDDLERTAQLLAALSEEVQALPLVGGPASDAPEDTASGGKEAVAEPEQRNLETLIKDGLSGLGSVISVRYHDVPASSLLPPPKQHSVYQNLLLQLDTARYALLRRDPALYQASLAKAGGWVKEYFDPAAPSTRSFRERLETASAASYAPRCRISPLQCGCCNADGNRAGRETGHENPFRSAAWRWSFLCWPP